MEPTFGIGIPTINRYDLLHPTLGLYSKEFPDIDIFVLDNGKQGIKNQNRIKVIEPNESKCVGASWNILIEKIFEKNNYALILNDDIYLGKSTENIKNIIISSGAKQKNKAFLTATPDWCAFIISQKIFKLVGKFDECFIPAYYEDNSYAYRMKLKGVPHIKTPLLNPFIYRSSCSLEKDYDILEARKKNKKIYIEMWGGEPEKEKYLTPYNSQKKQ